MESSKELYAMHAEFCKFMGHAKRIEILFLLGEEELCVEDIELIGVNTCGGCPGKKAVTREAEMVRRGADTIALASCITRGNPIGFPCPHAEQMKAAIEREVGQEIRLIDYTH